MDQLTKHDQTYKLRLEAEAAKQLIAFLRSEGEGEDQDLVEASVEGETALLESIDEALASIDESEVLIIGLKAKEEAFADRRKAIQNRVQMLRTAIERAIMHSEIPTPVRRPTATLSIATVKPGLVVEDEALIPSTYFEEQPRPAPKLNKKALLDALYEREAALSAAIEAARAIEDEGERAAAIADAQEQHPPIPGAGLDNGGRSLTVRRK